MNCVKKKIIEFSVLCLYFTLILSFNTVIVQLIMKNISAFYLTTRSQQQNRDRNKKKREINSICFKNKQSASDSRTKYIVHILFIPYFHY
jgi:hypothetical protein